MHLKKLELFGFKSFADRTAFEFHRGITGIVGPNGCGKSNVVDAFKWILGSQSAKGLRGSEMKDVIFNGTQTRKPLGLAEVTCVFDNRDRFFDVEYSEVAITRRLYRSGESEYLINKQKCRLKDIKDLLMDTGFGTTSYSILEQGKIDVLLQASHLDRRIIFEEAAGISKYRARKAEALRSLLRVEDNLSRLQDIIDEVEKRIRRVKAQASKARRYQEYSERLKELRVRMALEDYTGSVEGRTDLSFRLWWLQFRLQRLESLEGRLNSGLERELERRRELQEILREVRERISAERIAKERGQEKIANGKRRVEELIAEEARKLEELELTRAGLAELEESIDDERAQLAAKADDIAARKTAVDEAAERGRAAVGEQQSLQAALRERKEGIVSLLQDRAKAANAVVQVTTELSNLHGRKERLERSLATFRADLERLHAERQGVGEEIETAAAERDRIEAERARHAESAATLEARIEDLAQELADTRAETHRKSSRLEVLRSFEEQLDGVSTGVAELLRRQGEVPAWRGVHGLLASHLRVERRYSLAVEAVLGAVAQSLIVESQEGALELLDYARSEEVGAVTIISLDRVDDGDAAWFPRHGGVLGALRDKVDAPAHLAGLLDRLLANVVLVEDFDTALALARNGLRPFRLVTLRGEVLEPWGALSVCGASESGLISRQSEMEELSEELTALESQCEQVEGQLAERRAQRDAARGAAEEATRALDGVRSRVLRLEAQSQQSERELERLGKELGLGTAELTELDGDIASRVEEKAEKVQRIEELDLQRSETEDGVTALEASLAEAESAVQAANDAVSQARLELAQAEKHEEGLRQLVERQIQNIDERRRRLGDLDEEIRRTRDRAEASREEIAEASESLEEIALREEALLEELAGHEEKDHALLEIERAFRAEIEKVRREATAVSREREQLQLREQEERHRRNTVLERIDEEYGLDLRQLLERAAAAPIDESAEDAGSEGASPSESSAVAPTPLRPSSAPWVLGVAQRLEPRVQANVAEMLADTEDPADLSPRVDQRSDEERFLRPLQDWDRDAAQREARELQSKIRKLGNVNLEALDELEELEERFRFQRDQKKDLVESERSLRAIIADINAKSRELFQATFDSVQEHFKELFRKCFGGGKAELVLEEGVDILEAGIEIVARPPGKKLTSLSLMSGGERTMTTIALLLAIFRARPSPFCVLDEVDAPLDEANVRRFVVLIQEFLDNSQFIVVTHNKTTMSAAGSLYGVTMQERGVSKRVAVELESYDLEQMEQEAAKAR